MALDLSLALVAVFVSVALGAAVIASVVLSRTAPELRRLRPAKRGGTGSASGVILNPDETDRATGKPLRKTDAGKSRVRRQLASVGWDDASAASTYATIQIALAVGGAIVPLATLGVANGWILAGLAAIIGYLLPDLVLSRKIAERKRAIQNGLPDALDLLVVCVEAGSSLDHAILKASEELEIALPPMAAELRTVATEIRAGKPRSEAFQNFATRTRLDDVRALSAMLIQTDRFGTGIAQALRTHSDTLRTKRRQRAEERAGKVGVKLVFPLVLCLMPSLYVVCLGPVAVKIYRALY
jgi:tight adherence protein C